MNRNPARNRAERAWLYAAKSYGHSCKGNGKRGASKAARRLARVAIRETIREDAR
jgi:hypothetical protein